MHSHSPASRVAFTRRRLRAGAVATTIPVVIVFMFLQRNLTQELAAGSVTG